MKKILGGDLSFKKVADINFVTVPLYDELKPANVIEEMKLKTDKAKEELWKDIKKYCPELEYRSNPKDRSFFFNILNTLDKDCMDKAVYNARLNL